jgi:hypothetical protein
MAPGLVFFRSEDAAQKRSNPERGKEIRRGHDTTEPFRRFAWFRQIEAGPTERSHPFENTVLRLLIEKIRSRVRPTPGLGRRAEHSDQTFRVRVRKPSKQDRVHDAEHGSIRADAEREREHGHGGEAGVLQQLAEGEFEVVHGFAIGQ